MGVQGPTQRKLQINNEIIFEFDSCARSDSQQFRLSYLTTKYFTLVLFYICVIKLIEGKNSNKSKEIQRNR